MTCPNCGLRVRDGAKFCDECGIVLPDSAAAVTSAPEVAQQPAAPRRLEAPGSRLPPSRSRGSVSGYPMQSAGDALRPPVDMTRVRRIFATVALVLVALLCLCCALAAGALYYLTQNPPNHLFPGPL